MSRKQQGGLASCTVADVSSRTPNEKELRATRDQAMQLASIVASSKDAIISFGLDAVVQTWNVGATALFGYTSAEAIGQDVDHLIVPEDLRKERAQYTAVVSSGVPATLLDTIRKHKDGSLLPVELNASPILDSEGSVSAIAAIFRDLRERKAAELRLRESEQRFQLAIKAARALVYDVDVEAKRTAITYGLEQVTGYRDEGGRLTSEWWHSLVHPDDLAGHLAVLNAQFAKGGRYTSEYRLRHANGTWLWLRDDAEVMLGADGRPVRIIGTIVDRTRRIEAERALRRSHDTYLNLIQNNPFGVYLVDADFRLAQISAGAQKVFSHIRPLLGRDFAEILRVIWQEPFASEAIAHFRHTLATGEAYRSADTTENRGNIEVVESYDWKIERVALPDGRSGVVCYFYDMTERKRYEDQIKLLMGEVNHRAKNLLGIIQSVARQTARAGDPNTFVDRLSQRIGALAANQDLLVKSEWRGIAVPDLVAAQLAHFKDLIGSRVMLDGPPVRLASAAAQAIGMA